MSYGRMREESARLEYEIGELLSSVERVDDEEDAKFGSKKRGAKLPGELRLRGRRLAKIKQAMSELRPRSVLCRHMLLRIT